MGRPKLLLPEPLLIELHEQQRWSVRAIARYFQTSRWAIRETLQAAGIVIRDAVDASDLARYLEADAPIATQCLVRWCGKAAAVFCDEHAGCVGVAIEVGACAYPDCRQRPPRGKPFCYGHAKSYGSLL